MKTTLFFTLLFTFSALAEDRTCLEWFQNAYAHKEERYSKAWKRYHENRSRALFSNSFAIAAIGSALKAPSRDSYNMFEKDILMSIDPSIAFNTKLITAINQELKKKNLSFTREQVVEAIKKGFEEEAYCAWYGRKRQDGIARWVRKYLVKNKDQIQAENSTQINDSDAQLKDGSDSSTEKEGQKTPSVIQN